LSKSISNPTCAHTSSGRSGRRRCECRNPQGASGSARPRSCDHAPLASAPRLHQDQGLFEQGVDRPPAPRGKYAPRQRDQDKAALKPQESVDGRMAISRRHPILSIATRRSPGVHPPGLLASRTAEVSSRLVMHEERKDDDDRERDPEKPKQCTATEAHSHLLFLCLCRGRLTPFLKTGSMAADCLRSIMRRTTSDEHAAPWVQA
jgi:hypothetical protein